MKNVVADKMYSPQNFLEKLTGNVYRIPCECEDVCDFMHRVLTDCGIENEEYPLFDYPLDEIDEIVENDVSVVLIDCTHLNKEGEIENEQRWFEVPSGATEWFK